MATEQAQNGADPAPDRNTDSAAESTHMANHVPSHMFSRLGSDSSFASGQSIRLQSRLRRGGLALRIAVPVIVAMIVGLLVVFFILHRRAYNLQLSDLENDAANSAYTMGVLGRLLLTHKAKFLAENPDYKRSAEWRTGDHWLASHGFVDEGEWIRATGFGLTEYAPVDDLERAAVRTTLIDMNQWLGSPSTASTQLVATFILDAEGINIATSVSPYFRFDYPLLRTKPMGRLYADIGVHKVFVDYIADFEPEPVVRGIATIMAGPDTDERLGTAVVVFRTAELSSQQQSFILLLAILLAVMTAFMGLMGWMAARRVTKPLRRLAVDMQAIAEGDYARRSALVSGDEVGQLAQAFNSMAERLRVARASEKETSRLESDLAIARSIQDNLLPAQTPRIKGLDIHTTYRPAKEIGGDYFDFLPVDSQHVGVAIADASGKSIPAALVMSTTRAILRFVAPGNNSAAETLTRVNAILSVDIPKGMFVTAYYIILEPLNNSMLCASAGHTPLLLARTDGSVELLNPGGIALGFDNGPIFQRSIREQRVKLAAGDRVLMYTDGVVECVNLQNEEYSDRRLREFLRRNRELSSSDFVGALLADLDRHRGAADIRDDTTIVTFKVL